MTEQDSESPFLTWDEATRLSELANVLTAEVRVGRRDAGIDGMAPLPDDTEPADVQMAIFVNESDEQLSVRVILDHETRSLMCHVDQMVMFNKTTDFHLDSDELGTFIDFTALPILYPYLRQTVHEMTGRLGDPSVLSLLRVGQTRVSYEGQVAEQLASASPA